jgi:hypothetical protein
VATGIAVGVAVAFLCCGVSVTGVPLQPTPITRTAKKMSPARNRNKYTIEPPLQIPGP